MYCDRCGKVLHEGAVFCDQCGRKVSDSADTVKDAVKEPQAEYRQAPAQNIAAGQVPPTQGQPMYYHQPVQPYYAPQSFGYGAPYVAPAPAPRRIVHKSERIPKGRKNLIMILSIFCFLGYTGGWICSFRFGSAAWEISAVVTVFALSLHIMFCCLLRGVATWLTALPMMLVTAANTLATLLDLWEYRTMLIAWITGRYQTPTSEVYDYYLPTPVQGIIEVLLAATMIVSVILYTRATAFRFKDLRTGRIVATCGCIVQMIAAFVMFFLRHPDHFARIKYILENPSEASSTWIYLKWLLPEVLCIACPVALALTWFTMILIVWNTKKRVVTVTYEEQ